MPLLLNAAPASTGTPAPASVARRSAARSSASSTASPASQASASGSSWLATASIRRRRCGAHCACSSAVQSLRVELPASSHATRCRAMKSTQPWKWFSSPNGQPIAHGRACSLSCSCASTPSKEAPMRSILLT
ncbi:hypothetical protein D3C71_1300490 [compost metagenome]